LFIDEDALTAHTVALTNVKPQDVGGLQHPDCTQNTNPNASVPTKIPNLFLNLYLPNSVYKFICIYFGVNETVRLTHVVSDFKENH
jgi:hypothetical protein